MPAAAADAVAEGDAVLLTGRIDLTTVAGLADRARELVAGRAETRVDLAGVERADSAGLALLLELQRQANRTGGVLRFSNVPASLRAIADACGADAVLALESGGG
jgi:phospholipid transport system transporter-binding protein